MTPYEFAKVITGMQPTVYPVSNGLYPMINTRQYPLMPEPDEISHFMACDKIQKAKVVSSYTSTRFDEVRAKHTGLSLEDDIKDRLSSMVCALAKPKVEFARIDNPAIDATEYRGRLFVFTEQELRELVSEIINKS